MGCIQCFQLLAVSVIAVSVNHVTSQFAGPIPSFNLSSLVASPSNASKSNPVMGSPLSSSNPVPVNLLSPIVNQTSDSGTPDYDSIQPDSSDDDDRYDDVNASSPPPPDSANEVNPSSNFTYEVTTSNYDNNNTYTPDLTTDDRPVPAVFKVSYRNYRVNVYNTATPGYAQDPVDAGVQFYYEPALLMDPSLIYIRANPFTNASELIIPVFMWDDGYVATIEQAVSRRLGAEVPPGVVQMLKFDSVMLTTYTKEGQYSMESDYRPYANQPGVVNFAIVCGQQDPTVCMTMQGKIQQAPDYFANLVTIYYFVNAEDKTSNIVGSLKVVNNQSPVMSSSTRMLDSS